MLHPLFEAILRPYSPPPKNQPKTPTPEEIDKAMLADKLVDGYNQRNIARAIKLEKGQSPF